MVPISLIDEMNTVEERFIIVSVDVECFRELTWVSIGIVASTINGTILKNGRLEIGNPQDPPDTSSLQSFWKRHPKAYDYNVQLGKGQTMVDMEERICDFFKEFEGNILLFISDNPWFDVGILNQIYERNMGLSLCLYSRCICLWSMTRMLHCLYGKNCTPQLENLKRNVPSKLSGIVHTPLYDAEKNIHVFLYLMKIMYQQNKDTTTVQTVCQSYIRNMYKNVFMTIHTKMNTNNHTWSQIGIIVMDYPAGNVLDQICISNRRMMNDHKRNTTEKTVCVFIDKWKSQKPHMYITAKRLHIDLFVVERMYRKHTGNSINQRTRSLYLQPLCTSTMMFIGGIGNLFRGSTRRHVPIHEMLYNHHYMIEAQYRVLKYASTYMHLLDYIAPYNNRKYIHTNNRRVVHVS